MKSNIYCEKVIPQVASKLIFESVVVVILYKVCDFKNRPLNKIGKKTKMQFEG